MERDKHVSRNTSVAVHTWAIWFKRLRLVMWSLLHDTDQLREMLSTDQSMRDRRSRGRWSVLSISRGHITSLCVVSVSVKNSMYFDDY